MCRRKKISNGKEETAEGGLLEGSCRAVLMSWTLRSLLHNEGKVIIILDIVIIVVINRKINFTKPAREGPALWER